MFKKLRKKIVGFAMLAIFTIGGVLLGVINLISFSSIAKKGDDLTSRLLNNGGKFDENPPEIPDESNPGEQNPFIEGRGAHDGEIPFETRYFIVYFADDGNVETIDTSHSAVMNEMTAKQYGESVKNKTIGWKGDYRFRVGTHQGQTMAIFVDTNRELSSARIFLYSSLGVFGAGLIISFAIIYPLSKTLVRPLEIGDRKQKQFISDASHELKTPITIISANNEILEIENGESEMTQTINKQVTRLAGMVKNLNDLAKLDETNEATLTKLDLSEICLDAIDNFSSAFQTRNIHLDADVQPDIHLDGNEAMMRQLLSILLDNALKYGLTKTSVALKREGNRISLLIENDASNVKEGPLDEVFERFYRTDEVRGSQIEGSGIGLSIAKEIVRLHKGRIRAQGNAGTFLIRVEL